MAKRSTEHDDDKGVLTPGTEQDKPEQAYSGALEVRIRELEHNLGLLKQALYPFAQLPDAYDRPGEEVLYTLTRSSGQAQIKCGDIRAAKQALELK